MPNRIPLDPVLPKNFDCTPNEKRSKAQLDAWWDHPYGVTQPDGKIVVYCLNGGAWDRPSVLCLADNYDEACELAERQQARWVKTRYEPTFMFSLYWRGCRSDRIINKKLLLNFPQGMR